ncbi:MAG: hypothetical protein ACYS26_04085 [Planctomycetota bacterium]
MLAKLKQQSGNGGPSPGLGPVSELTFGAPTDLEAGQAAGLPTAGAMDFENSSNLGVSARAPEANPQGEAAGAAAGGSGDARSSVRRRLAPRHRDAVRSFFEDGE